MRLLKTVAGLQAFLQTLDSNHALGLVPTMGALHLGHKSLIQRSIQENQSTVVTIFVNPLQFSQNEDLSQYPRQLTQDCNLCETLGVDVVFAPSRETLGMTPDCSPEEGLTTTVVPPLSMTTGLCGQFRPSHFTGVATIVTQFLSLIQPTVAYFGEKDAQQLAVIRRLVKDLKLSVKIQGCPIVREPSGLAYSSRNQYLNEEEREQALTLSRSLFCAQEAFLNGKRQANALLHLVRQEFAKNPDTQLQYAELVHPDTLIPLETLEDRGLLAIAAYVGETRLIDNLILGQRLPIIAIDGPAGAGKSTVTRQIAQKLHLLYLDTGALYRGITWWVIENQIPLDDEIAIADHLESLTLVLIPETGGLKVNGQEVSESIRRPEVTAKVSQIAAQKAVRQQLVKYQQIYGKKGGLVAEGRDMGTVVFPNAELKIFLTASVQERAKRRAKDLEKQGYAVELDTLAQEIEQRDYVDSHRRFAPLRQAEDAVVINTDDLTLEEVVSQIINTYDERGLG